MARRVSYPTDLRKQARESGQGLVTISVLDPSGVTYEVQVAANAEACRFAKWVAANLSHEEMAEARAEMVRFSEKTAKEQEDISR